MKFKKFLDSIKNKYNFDNFAFINYSKIKSHILDSDILIKLNNEIDLFDKSYIVYYQNNNVDNKIFEFLLINYLSINKIIKKINKKNKKSCETFKIKHLNIDNYLSIFNFYNDIKMYPINMKMK